MKLYDDLAKYWPIFSGKTVRSFHDVHLEGLFPRATWRELVRSAGFTLDFVTDEWGRDLVVARKPSWERAFARSAGAEGAARG